MTRLLEAAAMLCMVAAITWLPLYLLLEATP